MAPTRSEIRDGAAFDFIQQCRNFHRSRDSNQRRAGRIRIEGGEKRFQRFRLDVLPSQIRGQLPQIVLPVAAQQGIDLIFQVADGQRIGRNFVALHERSFHLLDLRFLRGGEVAPPQFVAGVSNFLEDVAQLAGGALGGGSGIVEFMREPGRKLSQRSQPVALLFPARGFANSVGHQPDETLRQFRHLLHEFGKLRRRETQHARVRDGAGAHGKLLHSGKWQHAGHVSRPRSEARPFRRRVRRAPAAVPRESRTSRRRDRPGESRCRRP